MTDTLTIDLIERGIDAHPTCSCGRPTTAVERNGVMWVECPVLSEPVTGRFRRLVRAAGSYLHLRQSIG